MTTTEQCHTAPSASLISPSWCAEHLRWDDGTFIAHEAEIPTGIEHLFVNLAWNPEPTEAEPVDPYLHLDAIDVCLTPAQTRALAEARYRAADVLDGSARPFLGTTGALE